MADKIPNNRQRKGGSTTVAGSGKAIDTAYNEAAGGLKEVGPILGHLIPLGDAGAAQIAFDSGSTIAIFNNNTATAFCKFGTGTLSAPTDGSNAVCLPPKAYSIFAPGQGNIAALASATGCWAYQVEDDTIFQ